MSISEMREHIRDIFSREKNQIKAKIYRQLPENITNKQEVSEIIYNELYIKIIDIEPVAMPSQGDNPRAYNRRNTKISTLEQAITGDLERGDNRRLLAYIYKSIRSVIINYCDKQKNQKKINKSKLVYKSEVGDQDYYEAEDKLIYDDDNNYIDELDQYRYILSKLSLQEIKIVTLLISNKPDKYIYEQLGINRRTYYRIKKNLEEKIKMLLQK